MRTFGREPALWLAAVGVAVKLIGAFWIDLTTDQQAGLNAVAAAVIGLAVAAMVKDGQVAAVLGLAQALLAVALGFGLHFSAESQAMIMSFVGLVANAFVRTQVTAPVPQDIH
jgi:hypothetical protein